MLGLGHGIWQDSVGFRSPYEHWCNGEIEAANLSQLKGLSGLPDAVFHLAGGSSVGSSFANPREDFVRTVETTSRLLEWLKQNAIEARIVVVSSAAVYGPGHSARIPETSLPAPYSPYGFHKMMMESLCRSYGTNFGSRIVIVRLFSVYGPHLYKQLIWDLCCKIQNSNGKVIDLDGTGAELRDWLHVSDAVRLLLTARDHCSERADVINGGTGVGTSTRRIGELVCRAWPMDSELRFSGRQRKGDPLSLVSDPTYASHLGFSSHIALADGIRTVTDWFQSSRRRS